MEQEEWGLEEAEMGWCFGPEEFREELLEMIGDAKGRCHYGEELRESDQQKAERLVEQMLRRQKWAPEELRQRRKGDRVKAMMAKELRKETTMTWEWIANRLWVGNWRSAANAVHKVSKNQAS